MNVKDVIESNEFNDYLNKIIIKYNHRPAPPVGKRWSRTPYDSLVDKKIFTVNGLKTEYKRIFAKKSSLSYSGRKAVVKIVNECIIAVCVQEQKKKQETETTNKKKGK